MSSLVQASTMQPDRSDRARYYTEVGTCLGDLFDAFLDRECRSLGLTRDDLRAWRPEAKKRGKTAGKRKKASAEVAAESPADE